MVKYMDIYHNRKVTWIFVWVKDKGIKLLRSQKVTFFFNLIYKVVTLELEIKTGLEKLEASELTCEEAPCKLNVFLKATGTKQ